KVLSRLQKQSEEKEQEIQRLEAKLHNVEFTSKAPAEVIREHGHRLRILQQDSRLLVGSGQQLRAMMQSRKERRHPHPKLSARQFRLRWRKTSARMTQPRQRSSPICCLHTGP